MKSFFKIIAIPLLVLFFTACSKEYEAPQNIVVHDFVWKSLNAYYLYQDDIADLSDSRFSSDQQLNTFLNSFPGYNSLFSNLLMTNLLIYFDDKSVLIDDYTTITEPELRDNFTNGLEFGIIEDPNNTDNVIGYVTHILPNSDASKKDIKRGEFFNKVNGTQLTTTNYNNLLLDGADNFTLDMIDFNGTSVISNSKTVALKKENYTYSGVFLEKTITIGSDKIGYLMYNNDFSKNYINDLNNTFLNIKNQKVNELVLDFRYNIGGGSFAKNITEIASMITGQFTGQTIIKEEWNTKAQTWFLENQPDSLLTMFPKQLNNTTTNINSLNLTDVYIILNGENYTGSSAVELLINSLKSHINVHLIGQQTKGNNKGSITLYNSIDYNFPLKNTTHTVALQPIVLNFLNSKDQTYANGFSPNITLCENENPLTLGTLGEASDPILQSVLNYISTGSAVSSIACNPNNFQYLFNSITSQREKDKGVFIQQILPNTY